jgi:hypothetical protein
MPAPAVLFVFVVSDPGLANSILDLVSGKTAATLAALTAEEQLLLNQAQGIQTAPPPPA